MNMYFDQNVDYDGSTSLNIDMIDKNSTEFALGAEYGLSEKLRASAGWLGTFTGVNSNYQNDQRYSANTHTVGGGIGYRINPMIDINLAGSYTIYDLASKEYNHFLGAMPVPVAETYDKGTWIIAVGVDFTFGK
jgi:long-subunit fatty acid transport protein